MRGIRLLESQDPKKDHEKLFLENIIYFSDSFFKIWQKNIWNGKVRMGKSNQF
jgi:hypothetical protein